MKKQLFKTGVLLWVLVSWVTLSYSQDVQFMSPDTNLYGQIRRLNIYFDSLHTAIGDSAFFGEGSTYSQYQQFLNFWTPRLYPDGDFERYNQSIKDFYDSQSSSYYAGPYTQNVVWGELGPKQKPGSNDCVSSTSGCTAEGIGPIEFINFFAGDPTYMLCGSTEGGLFFSNDGASSWQSTGTDTKWYRSGCPAATFGSLSPDTWYAVSSQSGNNLSEPIQNTGGIFRTCDAGQTWAEIADQNIFSSSDDWSGYWTIIYKLLVVGSSDPTNPDILFAATSSGIFRSTNSNQNGDCSVNPSWTAIKPAGTGSKDINNVYDIEVKPGDTNILFATVSDWEVISNNPVNRNWHIMTSTNGGDAWTDLANQPSGLITALAQAQIVTIEVSVANPDKLYCLLGNGNSVVAQLWIFTAPNTWSQVTVTGLTPTYGSGEAFSVDKADENEIYAAGVTSLSASPGSDLMKINVGIGLTPIYSTYNGGQYHPDIEDIVCHPSNRGEVWMACHGGVYHSIDHGANWTDKSVGLGVAMSQRLDDSYIDADPVIIGCYHDGSMLTSSAYQSNWSPSWETVSGGDGTRCFIDPVTGKYMWTSSEYTVWNRSDNFGNLNSWSGLNFSPTLSDPWFTEGVLNKVDPSIIYRMPTGNEITRSSDRGNTDEPISTFSTNSALPNEFIWQLFTPYTNSKYLLAFITANTGSSTDQHGYLFRTTNATDPAGNVTWENLPIPRNGVITDVQFDPQNPDIVYIVYSTAPTNNTYGAEMVFKMDYTTPSSVSSYVNASCPTCTTTTTVCTTGCTDLTGTTLPPVGAAGLVVEKGSNNGLYLTTDVGVYYTNNALLGSTGWKQHGANLPHVPGQAIEINYQANQVRVATFGRGVWEADLVCPDQTDIAINSLSGSPEWDECYGTLTASTVIVPNNNYQLTYRATQEIDLLPGFDAQQGSNFRAFIHGCDAPGNSNPLRKSNPNNSASSNTQASNSISTDLFSVYPNPNVGSFHISMNVNDQSLKDIIIYDVFGKQVFQNLKTDKSNLDIDISQNAKGVYLVKVVSGDKISVSRVVYM